MTPTQFAAITELAQLREGPACEAVRLHLMGDLPVPVAARQAGCSYRSAWNAVQRVQRRLQLARAALGGAGVAATPTRSKRKPK